MIADLFGWLQSWFGSVGEPAADPNPQPKAAAGSPPINKSLDSLDFDFAQKMSGYMAESAAIGYPLDLLECKRTAIRQAWIYGQGRPGYTYLGVLYGREGSIVTNAQPGHGKHETGRAADTWPKGVKFDAAGNKRAIEIFGILKYLRDKYGLKNLPSISDFGHCEDL